MRVRVKPKQNLQQVRNAQPHWCCHERTHRTAGQVRSACGMCRAVRGRVRSAMRCALLRHRDARPYKTRRLQKCCLLHTFVGRQRSGSAELAEINAMTRVFACINHASLCCTERIYSQQSGPPQSAGVGFPTWPDSRCWCVRLIRASFHIYCRLLQKQAFTAWAGSSGRFCVCV